MFFFAGTIEDVALEKLAVEFDAYNKLVEEKLKAYEKYLKVSLKDVVVTGEFKKENKKEKVKEKSEIK